MCKTNKIGIDELYISDVDGIIARYIIKTIRYNT